MQFAQAGCPIENLELSHFAFPVHQVSLDIITKKEYIPGTTQFKETYLNKQRSLRNIGWKHLAFDEAEVKEISLVEFIKSVQDSYLPYVEEQQKVIEYADYQRAEEVENIKMVRDMADLDIKYLNKLFSDQAGEEDDEEEIDPITGEVRKNLLELEKDAKKKEPK